MPKGWAISPARHQTAPVRVHKDKTTTSQRRICEEEDIHKIGTKTSNNLRLQNEIKITTKRIREDNGRRGNNKEKWCSNQTSGPRHRDQPWHLSTNNCNHKHAKCDMEKELMAFIKENSLCDCKDCSMKEEDNKEKELTKLIKENPMWLQGVQYKGGRYQRGRTLQWGRWQCHLTRHILRG